MNHLLRAVLLLCLLCAAAVASANVAIIARLKNPYDAAFIGFRYRIQIVDRIPGAPFVLYRAASEADADRAVAQMSVDPRIVWVEEDDEFTSPEDLGLRGAPYKGSILPAVGDRSVLYKGNAGALAQINFSKKNADQPGRAVRVAILDTGLSPQQGYLWAKTDFAINLVEPGLPAHDVERGVDTNGDGVKDAAVGHGTMVAGVVDQLAPQSRFSIVRLCDSDGIATGWNLIKGLAYAVLTGCEVANVSLGSQNDLAAMSDVMDWCEEKNLLVVAAMGNNNADKAAFPARISKVVAVGGLLPDNKKAPFSNFESKCDFSGPATGIISQWHDGRIGEWSGTSFSAPMVTGAIVDALKMIPSPMRPGLIRDRIDKVGRNLDDVNQSYRGKLGVLLDVPMIRSAIRGKLAP